MKRRDFLVGASASTVAWPLAARAQRTVPKRRDGQPWLIAALVNATRAQSDVDWLAPFRKGMLALGLEEGRDYVIEARFTDGDAARAPAFAKELVGLGPDLLVTANSASASVLLQFTRTVPILAANLGEGELETLIGRSLARPAGNVTGIMSDIRALVGKHCDLALEVVPGATRIGVLLYGLGTEAASQRPLVTAAAAARKFTPIFVDVNKFDELAPAYQFLVEQRVGVAIVGASSLLAADRQRAVAAAATAKLPAVYNAQEYVEAGGLISYGYDRRRAFERLATYADRILAGDRPADLPVEQTSNYLMAINLKTARSLGLTISPTVLFRADHVIE